MILLALAAGCGSAHAATPAGTTSHAPATTTCAARVATARVASAVPDRALDQKWSSYVTSDAGWTGGDSVYTYALGGAGTLYSYADSFIGGVTANRRKVKLIYHNLFVVDGPGGMRLVTGGTPADPQPLVTAPYGKDFYLGLGGIVEGGQFQELFMERDQVGTGSLDNVPVGTVIATFSLPALQLVRVAAVPDTTGKVNWGSYVHRFGGWTYVYGATSWGRVDRAYVARVAGGDLQDPWSYWDGNGWTPDARKVAPIADEVQTEFGVADVAGMYELVSSRGGPDLRPVADVYFGCSPVGPWARHAEFRLATDVGPVGAAVWGDPQVYVYDAMVQPALRPDSGQLVVSFDRNDLELRAVMAHASIYEPSYLDLTFTSGA